MYYVQACWLSARSSAAAVTPERQTQRFRSIRTVQSQRLKTQKQETCQKTERDTCFIYEGQDHRVVTIGDDENAYNNSAENGR